MFDWRESTTFMAIYREGQEIGARNFILRLGTKRLGEPGEEIVARLNAITDDLERLERILDRSLDATTWADLLDTP